MLLRWVWPQHVDDDVARQASDECLARRSPVRTLGRGGRPKVRPATDSIGPVQTKPKEPKRRVVPGVSVTPRPSIRSTEFVETHDVSLPGAPTVGVLYRRQ
jgi:hypothetical protein